ncbi:MAG: spondin domain-containing protein [Anaerolineae bacterium]
MFKKIAGTAMVALTLFGLFLATPFTPSAQADGQRFIVSVDNVSRFKFKDLSVFNTPVGNDAPGPLLPGRSYQTVVHGLPGDRVSFATMFVQTNDWFFAPNELGIPLYNADGTPKSGDVTAYVGLWDSGTEIDEAVGEGIYQAPRQAGADTGPADLNGRAVREITDRTIANYVEVTLTPSGSGRFVLNIKNVSERAAAPTPLAPGVAVTHVAPGPLFARGQADWGQGLEALAEDGNPAILYNSLKPYTGANTPIAPVAWAVGTEQNPIFTSGQRASAGLEALAEDGGPGALVAELAPTNKGAAAIGRGANGPGPIFPNGGNYSFEIVASSGDQLSLAAMFVQTNDWFFSVQNLPLFDSAGNPIVGNVTHHIRTYDAGTEVDQPAGFGSYQAPRQAGPNSGPSQGGVVTGLADILPENYIHVTITPVN